MSQSLIGALDVPGKQDVEQFLRHFEGEELCFKV
ncbi:MAG: orotidine-5'-phosphate decarboxylase, partial [Bacillus sp. (in: Bacteria)]|nr:orotidine-5'-phosphate decarboxylase [Bacillus sp. (in: firmicutes)]